MISVIENSSEHDHLNRFFLAKETLHIMERVHHVKVLVQYQMIDGDN